MKPLYVIFTSILIAVYLPLHVSSYSVGKCSILSSNIVDLQTGYLPLFKVNLISAGYPISSHPDYLNTTAYEYQSSFASTYVNHSDADTVISTYPVGNSVICYFDPGTYGGSPSFVNPIESSRLSSSTTKNWIIIGVLLAIVLFPITILIILVALALVLLVLALALLILLIPIALIVGPIILIVYCLIRLKRAKERERREFEMSPISNKFDVVTTKVEQLSQEGSGSYLSLLPVEVVEDVVAYVKSAKDWRVIIPDSKIKKPQHDVREEHDEHSSDNEDHKEEEDQSHSSDDASV